MGVRVVATQFKGLSVALDSISEIPFEFQCIRQVVVKFWVLSLNR